MTRIVAFPFAGFAWVCKIKIQGMRPDVQVRRNSNLLLTALFFFLGILFLGILLFFNSGSIYIGWNALILGIIPWGVLTNAYTYVITYTSIKMQNISSLQKFPSWAHHNLQPCGSPRQSDSHHHRTILFVLELCINGFLK